MPEYDFKGLAERLLGQAETLLSRWLPGGRREGREWVCADLSGAKGKTLKVNLDKGIWHDFSSGEGGGDMIDLYRAIRNISLGEAFRELSNDVGFITESNYVPPEPKPKPKPETGPPPNEDVLKFSFATTKLGTPIATWIHRSETGQPLMVAARYDYIDDDGEKAKAVLPWSWNLKENRWVMRSLGWPSEMLQPLYGAEKLPLNPGKQVLIVEGAKKADAAQRMVGDALVVLSWPGGASAVRRVDWAPISGRSVVLWPDADRKRLKLPDGSEGEVKPYPEQPGPRACQVIGEILSKICPSVKVVDVGIDMQRPDGWDAADAESEGWDLSKLLAWLKPRASAWASQSQSLHQPAALLQPQAASEQPQASKEEILPPRLEPQEDGPNVSFSIYATWERLNISTSKSGQPYYNADNCLRFLTNETLLENYIWYDDFYCKIFTQFDLSKCQPMTEPREWTEMDEIELMIHMQRHVGLVKMNLDMVRQGVKLYASKHVRNAPREWFNKLVWDGNKRIEAFFPYAFGAEMNEYTMAASKNWLSSIAARVLMPGCKVDTMVLLRGDQGVKKSMALRALGGPWFADLHQSVDSKDFYISLHGKLVVELAELSAFNKAGAEAIKKMLSTQFDDYRPVFGKYNINHPRYTVFAGSTNETFFLNDPTGARRFWPVTCKKINVPWIEENREQLFAEAAERVKTWQKTKEETDGWWLMPDMETRAVQELHRQFDEWENTIAAWLETRNTGFVTEDEITVSMVAQDALGIEKSKLDRMIQMRIGKILLILGWVNKVKTVGGSSMRVWTKI